MKTPRFISRGQQNVKRKALPQCDRAPPPTPPSGAPSASYRRSGISQDLVSTRHSYRQATQQSRPPKASMVDLLDGSSPNQQSDSCGVAAFCKSPQSRAVWIGDHPRGRLGVRIALSDPPSSRGSRSSAFSMGAARGRNCSVEEAPPAL